MLEGRDLDEALQAVDASATTDEALSLQELSEDIARLEAEERAARDALKRAVTTRNALAAQVDQRRARTQQVQMLAAQQQQQMHTVRESLRVSNDEVCTAVCS